MKKAKDIIAQAAINAFPQLAGGNCPTILITTPSPKLGVEADYVCTSPMQLKKLLDKLPQIDGTPAPKLDPNQVAEAIVVQLKSTLASQFEEYFEQPGTCPPGFIYYLVKKDYTLHKIFDLLKQGNVEIKHQATGRVIVDYSSPNIAKEMHVGHLRSTIIGDCIARLLEFAHYDVLKLNHVGDWGTQFGMLLALLFEQFGDDYTRFTNEIGDLQSFYQNAKKRFDQDEDFKKRSYEMVVQLQSKQIEATKAWNHICDISRREFQKIYERLGVLDLTERGESFYQDHMKEVVQDLGDRNLLIEEEGRKILWPSEPKKKNEIPLTLVKSDGGFTYDTSDLAAVRQRAQEEKANRVLYVADNGQAVHFQNVFNAAKRVGYASSDVKLEHVGFGLVLGEDRKKFKTRSGDTVKLAELLDEGLERSMAKLIEKKRNEELTPEEMKAAQEAVAYGCIKYADLSRDRNKDYVFSFDQMLEDKGNTAVYLLYSLTRIRSIKRKADLGSIEDILQREDCKAKERLELNDKTEIRLAKFLLKFPDVILQCIDDLLFHLLCNYLYELSGVFTDFYESCYCIERTDQSVKIHYDRILLCEATALVMDRGLSLLGLKTVSRM